jgi:hypothetical protein
MAGANSNIQLTELDFNKIKTNLKTFLQSQDTLKDYNYEGSALSTLLDILSVNTQYNAFYLNMVGNEMFLDSAIQRSSVVSHAKALGYVPKSSIAPTATINFKVNQVNDASLTLPKFTTFMSEAIDGVNYNFVTADSTTVNVISNVATFNNVTLKQGIPVTQNFVVDSATNPTYTFELPDPNIDTTTLQVTVQQSSSVTGTQIYDLASSMLSVDGSSTVYFLQENMNGNYDIYFGDNVLGKQLVDGNIVTASYVVTQGTASAGANNFIAMDSISGYSNTAVFPLTAASAGSSKETIESIKYQAPKAYSAQNRSVTKEDYITALQQNTLGVSFDSVNVWGGEENDPPVYGQVFICLKPTGGYSLTETQKTRLIQDVIKPISVVTVTPTIVEPDYTYLKVTANVLYDPKRTTYTANQISQLVKTAINNFSTETLNTFESTFSAPDLSVAIQSADSSIITNEIKIQVQKKFYPNLTTPTTYNLYFGTELAKSTFLSGINSSPATQFRDPINLANIIDGVYVEEVPSATGGVESISIVNPGFGYQYAPTVEILGDGTGAKAEAIINTSGSLRSIRVVTPGTGYTSALVKITPSSNDTTGQMAVAIANLEGRYGTLREYYNNTENVKTVFNADCGTIDYMNGIVKLTAFGPSAVDNDLGQLTITATPTSTILSSSRNKIITIDPFDSNSIVVNVTAK